MSLYRGIVNSRDGQAPSDEHHEMQYQFRTKEGDFTMAEPQSQRPVVQVRINSTEEARIIGELIASSNIDSPDGVTNRAEAVRDIKVLESLVTRGEAGNYAATFLALRQIPFTSPAGDDNIREMSARMLQTAMATKDPNIRTITLCPVSGSCNFEPLKSDEVLVASGGGRTGALALSTMQPNRGLPINRPVAAITGFLDAQMNTSRFLSKDSNGRIMTLPETVAALQALHSPAETRETLTSCIANENTYSINECAIAGIRAGVTFNNESGVLYNGAQFLGISKPASQQR